MELIMEPAPVSLDSVLPWAARHGMTPKEGRRRYFQRAAILSIAADPVLRDGLILHGSAALWLTEGHRRSGADVDLLSKLHRLNGDVSAIQPIEQRIGRALSAGMRRFVPEFNEVREELTRELRVEVVPNYIESEPRKFDLGNAHWIHASNIDFIVAEKVCAILVQIGKRSHRGKDLVDICHILKAGRQVYLARVRRYVFLILEVPGTHRGLAVRPNDPELRLWIEPSYEAAICALAEPPITLDDAWVTWLHLARRLGL